MCTLSQKSTPIKLWTENLIEKTTFAHVANCPDVFQLCQVNIHFNFTFFLAPSRFFFTTRKENIIWNNENGIKL